MAVTLTSQDATALASVRNLADSTSVDRSQGSNLTDFGQFSLLVRSEAAVGAERASFAEAGAIGGVFPVADGFEAFLLSASSAVALETLDLGVSSSADFTVRFDVQTEAEYRITGGNEDFFFGFDASGIASLTQGAGAGGFGDVFLLGLPSLDGSDPPILPLSGTLGAGSYTLSIGLFQEVSTEVLPEDFIDLGSERFIANSGVSFTVTEVPEPASAALLAGAGLLIFGRGSRCPLR